MLIYIKVVQSLHHLYLFPANKSSIYRGDIKDMWSTNSEVYNQKYGKYRPRSDTCKHKYAYLCQ